MKTLEQMTLKELISYKEMLKNDALWAGIGYADYYWHRAAEVNAEIEKRYKESEAV